MTDMLSLNIGINGKQIGTIEFPVVLPDPPTRIYTTLNNDVYSEENYSALGIEKALIAYRRAWDPRKSFTVAKPENLSNDAGDGFLDVNYPDPSQQIVLALDWEGLIDEALRSGPAHHYWQQAVDQWCRLLDLVHQLRPNAIIGGFHHPKLGVNTIEQVHLDNWLSADPIWQRCDCVFPAVYDHEVGSDIAHHQQEVALGRQIADIYGLRNLVFMKDLYHGGSRDTSIRDKVIPDDELEHHLRGMYAAGADAIVCWHPNNTWDEAQRFHTICRRAASTNRVA